MVSRRFGTSIGTRPGNANYIRRFNQHFSLMAGLDYLREAPRHDDLDHYASTDPYGSKWCEQCVSKSYLTGRFPVWLLTTGVSNQ
jgi:hypothetical protein